MNLYSGWVVVAAGGLLGCGSAGAVFSLAVLLQPLADDTGWSRTGVSTAMTIVFLAMGLASFGWGALSDRFGPRPVVLGGALLLGLGLLLASRARSLLEAVLWHGGEAEAQREAVVAMPPADRAALIRYLESL